MNTTYAQPAKELPVWALQRVETALDKLGLEPNSRIDTMDLARKAGLSKSLTRRCVRRLRQFR